MRLASPLPILSVLSICVDIDEKIHRKFIRKLFSIYKQEQYYVKCTQNQGSNACIQ